MGGADGIILASMASALVVERSVREAAHVPVVNNAAVTAKRPASTPALVAGENPDPNAWRGRVSADWMIWNSKGKAQVVMFRTDDAGLETRDAATVARLKQCPGCKVLYQDLRRVRRDDDAEDEPADQLDPRPVREQGEVHPHAVQRGGGIRRAGSPGARSATTSRSSRTRRRRFRCSSATRARTSAQSSATIYTGSAGRPSTAEPDPGAPGRRRRRPRTPST